MTKEYEEQSTKTKESKEQLTCRRPTFYVITPRSVAIVICNEDLDRRLLEVVLNIWKESYLNLNILID